MSGGGWIQELQLALTMISGGTDLWVFGNIITAGDYKCSLHASCLKWQQVMGEEDPPPIFISSVKGWFIDPHSLGKNTLIAGWTYTIKEWIVLHLILNTEREVKQDMKMISETHAIPVNKICIRQSLQVIWKRPLWRLNCKYPIVPDVSSHDCISLPP